MPCCLKNLYLETAVSFKHGKCLSTWGTMAGQNWDLLIHIPPGHTFLNGIVSNYLHYFNCYLILFCPLPGKCYAFMMQLYSVQLGVPTLMPTRHLPGGEEGDRKGPGPYLHPRRQAHDGKVFQLVLLSCAQFWQALLVGCSVPPTTRIKTQNKIRISSWNKHTNSPHQTYYWITVMTLHLLMRQMFHKHLLSSLKDHVLPKKKKLNLYT